MYLIEIEKYVCIYSEDNLKEKKTIMLYLSKKYKAGEKSL
jgi:hypothetical protein